jgi:hypothetical protein
MATPMPSVTTAAKVPVNGVPVSPAGGQLAVPVAHPVLLAGLPLAAAALLMGVYLLILRVGAV